MKAQLKVLKNKKKVLILTYKTRLQLCQAILRIQEVYESPKFRNIKGFTVDEYKIWYTKEYGEFNYYEIWDGFNIPKHIFPFFIKYFRPFSQAECEILMYFWSDDPDYVIAVSEESDPSTLKHELVHALYALRWQYRLRCWFILVQLSTDLFNCFKSLLNEKYHWLVLSDELNAYLVENQFYPDKINNKKRFNKVKDKLIKLYETYSK